MPAMGREESDREKKVVKRWSQNRRGEPSSDVVVEGYQSREGAVKEGEQ